MNRELEVMLTGYVPDLAKQLARKFPSIGRADVEQECWAGILVHQEELSELLTAGRVDHAKADARQHATKAVLTVHREQDNHEKAAKALSAGYEPDDQKNYSIPVIRVLLAAYVTEGVVQHPPRGREIQPGSGGDPAEGGNWLAMMLDIDMAFWAISRHHRNLLARYFTLLGSRGGAGEWTHEDVASNIGIPPDVLRGRVFRGIQAMQRHLNR